MSEDRIKGLFLKLRLELTNAVINQDDSLLAYDRLRAAYNNLPTNPTFKFAVGQEVWLLKNDRVQKGNVRVRQITESSEPLQSESNYFRRNIPSPAKSVIVYSLCKFNDIDPNWLIEESELFASKTELLESL